MRVIALTHGSLVGAELFADVVRASGHELVEWEVTERGVPRTNGFDAAIVLGGEMNVGEELEHPWLRDEYELLRELVADGTPLLAICLGAQTLAHAAGAAVRKLPSAQRGFHEVELTDAGRSDPVLGVLPARFPALFGNSYLFDLPGPAVDLAESGGRPQAYRLGAHAWGMQFHPEVRRGQLLAWWRREPDLPRLEAELDAGLDGWQELGRTLCLAFLREAA